jgi:hypothetical protein
MEGIAEALANLTHPRSKRGNIRSRIPTPTRNFPNRGGRSIVRSASFPTTAADIDTSSGSGHILMKKEIPSLYHKPSHGGREEPERSIRISTSTFPEVQRIVLPPLDTMPTAEQTVAVAVKAARMAFLQARPAQRRSLSPTPKAFSPRTQMRKGAEKDGVKDGRKAQGQERQEQRDQGDVEDIGGRSRTHIKTEEGRQAGVSWRNATRGMVTCDLVPGGGRRERTLVAPSLEKPGAASQAPGPQNGMAMLITMVHEACKAMVNGGWQLVQAVASADTPFRRRWARGDPTLGDVGLVGAMCGFAIGVLVAGLLGVRVLLLGIRGVRMVGGGIRAVTGLGR